MDKEVKKRTINPNSLKNLRPRKKGDPCLHPEGRPRNEASITNIMRKKLDDVCSYDSQGRTWGEYLAERWMASALENATYFNTLIERLEGKITQPIDANVDSDIIFTIGKGYTEKHDKTD